MNKKVALLLAVFLLLVPFRLPIGVLFINLVTEIATIAGSLSHGVLVANVVVTKIIYDIALAVPSLYNIEMLSREVKGRRAKSGYRGEDDDVYWWIVPIGIMLVAYIFFDAFTTHDLYYELIR